ncbi:MAG: hypothetical protein JWQ98_3436 [Chlorobi bacterium]|nr:hypothetical protein [Chlorobiota bacterium]
MIQTKDRERDAAAIRELFTRMNDAWHQGDADAFSSIFTEDCDYVTFNGMHLKGRAETVEVHRGMFNSFMFRGARLEGSMTQLRFLNDTTAIVHTVGALLLRWQKKVPESRRSINTTVLVKQDGRWLITAFHNCRIRKMGRLATWLMSR